MERAGGGENKICGTKEKTLSHEVVALSPVLPQLGARMTDFILDEGDESQSQAFVFTDTQTQGDEESQSIMHFVDDGFGLEGGVDTQPQHDLIEHIPLMLTLQA